MLLLATFLGMQRLDSEGLWYDEIWSVRVAGGANYGPLSPQQILANVVFNDPTQGMGYPLLLAGQGALAGWSEFSIRVLSLFAGVLAVALVYRLGREVDRPLTGLLAAMILGVSSFFVWYLHEGRTYSLVVLLALILLWSYHRLLYGPSPSWKSGAAFVFSGAGLLYGNYFAIILPAAVAGYHLLFAPKNRRWWYITYLAVLAGIVFLPSLIGLAHGVERFVTWEAERARALPVPQLFGMIGYFAANGSTLLLLILLVAGAMYAFRQGRSASMMVVLSLFTLLFSLVMQAALQLMDYTKVRYVLPLWGLLAVWTAMGMVFLAGQIPMHIKRWPRSPRLALAAAVLIPVIWLVGGVHASLDPFFMTEKGPNGDIPRWRTLVNVLRDEGLPGSDVFAYYAGKRAHDDEMSFYYSMYEVPFNTFITFSAFEAATADWALGKISEARRVWYGMDRRFPPIDDHEKFLQILADNGFSPCPTPRVAKPTTSLQLYVRSAAFCPGGEAVARFGDGITLTGWQPLPENAAGSLTLPMGWTIGAAVPAQDYSIGVYLLAGDTLITQGDTGLPSRAFGIAESMLDLSAVPPGTYTLAMAVYHWQTGERLNGENLQTGEAGNLLKMGEIGVNQP